MLLSKGVAALRAVRCLKQANVNNVPAVRNSHVWNYRTRGPEASKNVLLFAEFVGATAWWWVLWHCWTEPGHIFGEFGAYPEPSEWTDEELGIPPVDE